ncbi:MAG: N-acetylneuraminate synthase family protein [Vicinamibacterales bacterium]
MNDLTLGSRSVGASSDPYVIAEIGVNHEGSLELARALIRKAAAGGCHAAKFQTYKASTLASRHSPAYWDTAQEASTSQFALFSRYDQFGEGDYRALAACCRETGIDFVSTPFDDAAVDFLDELMPYFKIASADLTNVPFLRRIARKQKPVLLSTGASTLGEIDDAIAELRRHGCPAIGLLHCVLNYPTRNTDAHLAMIAGLARAYPDLVIGYSDHTLPDDQMTSLVTAYLVGARVLEKHFTHDKSLPGNDHYHAMDEGDARRLFARLALVRDLLGGSDHKAPLDEEMPARLYARRSLVTTKALAAGAVLEASSLTYKRPGTGISPQFWDEIVGMRTSRELEADHVLTWADVSK